MRTYEAGSGDSRYVEGLALDSAGDSIAVFARNWRSGNLIYGQKYGYIFLIRSSDGGHISKKATKVSNYESGSSDKYGYLTSSSAMAFKNDGQVLIAWYLYQGTDSVIKSYLTALDGEEYEGRLRIAQYNPTTESFDRFMEQPNYFGQSSAIAYGTWSSDSTTAIYLGGATDNSRWQYITEPMEWGPIIYHLKDDLSMEELWKLKLAGAW